MQHAISLAIQKIIRFFHPRIRLSRATACTPRLKMHLTRCQDQKRQTLEEFYGEWRWTEDPDDHACGQVMLDLIERLRALPDERRVYGLTSHYHLWLLAEDTYTSPWNVSFIAASKEHYAIEYRMPESEAPWPHAHIRGVATSEDEAVQMILTAMEKSGGWSKAS